MLSHLPLSRAHVSISHYYRLLPCLTIHGSSSVGLSNRQNTDTPTGYYSYMAPLQSAYLVVIVHLHLPASTGTQLLFTRPISSYKLLCTSSSPQARLQCVQHSPLSPPPAHLPLPLRPLPPDPPLHPTRLPPAMAAVTRVRRQPARSTGDGWISQAHLALPLPPPLYPLLAGGKVGACASRAADGVECRCTAVRRRRGA